MKLSPENLYQLKKKLSKGRWGLTNCKCLLNTSGENLRIGENIEGEKGKKEEWKGAGEGVEG